MDPAGLARLGSAVTGLLRETHVGRGDKVQRGDLIARVDSSVKRASRNVLELRATNRSQIESARARLDYIESKRGRTEKLMRRGITSEEVLAEIEAEVIAARSLLRQAEMEQELARLEHGRAEAIIALRDIRSPVDGVVSERLMSAGEFVHQDAHVVTVVQLDPLHVETYLPVELYRQLKPGDTATIFPAPPIEGRYDARVDVVDEVFDIASGTFGVRLVLPNPDGLLPAGHRCTIELPAITEEMTDDRLVTQTD